ncbi:MAG TPA: hypothetical protein VKR52_04615 [Terracidiphilus sp.]|nr:hypothetical protein [Terracidiphilus sp.]
MLIVQNGYGAALALQHRYGVNSIIQSTYGIAMSVMLRFRNLTLSNPESNHNTLEL